LVDACRDGQENLFELLDSFRPALDVSFGGIGHADEGIDGGRSVIFCGTWNTLLEPKGGRS
jgi:hypothetical protein